LCGGGESGKARTDHNNFLGRIGHDLEWK
jgi:hypothetical protein